MGTPSVRAPEAGREPRRSKGSRHARQPGRGRWLPRAIGWSLPVKVQWTAGRWFPSRWAIDRTTASFRACAGQGPAGAHRYRTPGAAVSIGWNSPRIASGASGFRSNESCWPIPPLSKDHDHRLHLPDPRGQSAGNGEATEVAAPALPARAASKSRQDSFPAGPNSRPEGTRGAKDSDWTVSPSPRNGVGSWRWNSSVRVDSRRVGFARSFDPRTVPGMYSPVASRKFTSAQRVQPSLFEGRSASAGVISVG